MGSFMEALTGRRSIRKFADKAVSDEVLNQVLEAVRWSPSWANSQCWDIVNVKDAAIRHKLQGTFSSRGNPARDAIVSAPVLLALCGRLKAAGYYKGRESTKFGDWFMFDLGIAAQTLCLAAYDLGLGTVIVGLFDHNQASEVLNVPEGIELVALIPMGFPAKSSKAPVRRQIAEFVRENGF